MTLGTGVCKYCACTETNPCIYGCAWTDDTRTLCTVCQDAAETARELVAAASTVLPPLDFDQLPVDQQARLVAFTRELVDSIRDGIAQAMNEEALEAVRAIDRLSGFVLEHVPTAEIGDEETAVDIAIRLLKPHIGSRLVLPGGGR